MVAYRVTTNYSDKPGGLTNTPEGGVFELQESHAKTTKTNDDIASSVVGLGSDQEKIADKVKATCANVAQLKKDFEEFVEGPKRDPSVHGSVRVPEDVVGAIVQSCNITTAQTAVSSAETKFSCAQDMEESRR